MRKISVFDTTLRDGEQGIGNLMSIEQKTQLALKLDLLNLDIIELGFPAASAEDEKWFMVAAGLKLKTKVCAFSRMNLSDIKKTVQVMKGFNNYQIQLLGVGSHLHLEKKRKISLSEAKKELSAAICFLKNENIHDISIIFEDASRSNKEYLLEMLNVAIACQVTTITFADTVGCSTPREIEELIQWARRLMPDSIEIGIHCHNDLGLATANTLAAISSGAQWIQTTLGGIGERAGNCALEEVAAVLHYKTENYNAKTELDMKQLVKASSYAFEVLKKELPDNKPIIGLHVFSTAAGIHQNGIIKNPENYEYVRPQDFGRERKFIFNRLSSKKMELEFVEDGHENTVKKINAFYASSYIYT